jgi:tetratricopeptide (TPR) repeat protein
VQKLARTLADRKAELKRLYRVAFDAGNLPQARRQLATLRTLDPFDNELETDERQLQDALHAEIGRRMNAGRRGFAAGDYDASTRAFEAVLELDPDNESARGYLSYIATIQHESEAAGQEPAAFKAPETFASDAQRSGTICAPSKPTRSTGRRAGTSRSCASSSPRRWRS